MKYLIQGKHGKKEINLNRRKAIRERCLNCAGWFYKDVVGCEFEDCSLYPFRSGQGKQNAKERIKAVRSYCLWCMVGKRSEIAKCSSPDCSLFPYRMSRVDRTAEIKSMPKKRTYRGCF